MPRRQWFFIAAMAMLVVLIMAWEWTQRVPNGPAGDNRAYQATKTGAPQNKSDGIVAWAVAHPDTFFAGVVAVFTVVLAVSTAGLWTATLIVGARQREDMQRLASATRRSANATRDMAAAMARPKIRIRNVVVRAPRELGNAGYAFFPNQFVSGQLYIVNIGATRARVFEIHCRVFWPGAGVMTLPMERPYEGEEPMQFRVELIPGQSEPISFSSYSMLGEQESDQVLRGARNIYVLGNVAYQDDSGVIRRTAFCRKYDHARGRFFAVDDPDYEHEE